ncbi:hypothetical protein [Tritonibacter mobilis]|uniref:hypothetical protein n=1 Tax=Tritonibacter mobilis TaxID=379347 RepID=UPI000806A409|nr:hypothetical protein [Tritonibacter mobilis]
MRSLLTKFGVSLLCSAGMAQAFCDDILATQVLCLTEEADEIKVCSSQHPETGDPVLELHVTPQISDGPIYRLAADVPFGMTPGTGGFPWDVHEFSFLHEGGRAVLSVKTPMDTDDTSDAEIWLDLFGRGTAPDRSLSCMQPALSAEVENLLALRRVSMNTMRTGPSADSAPFYQPSKPIPGATPHGSYDCREVAGVLSNEGTENGQIALYAAPSEEAAILGYAFPSDLGSAFECVSEDGYSGIIWIDPNKGDGAGGYMAQLDYEARLAACSMTPDDWPPNMAYWGNCSSAWVKQGNIAGFGG